MAVKMVNPAPEDKDLKAIAKKKALWLEVMQEISNAMSAKAEAVKPTGASQMAEFNVQQWGQLVRASKECVTIMQFISTDIVQPTE